MGARASAACSELVDPGHRSRAQPIAKNGAASVAEGDTAESGIRAPAPRARLVEPFLPYLLQRWADGCRNGRQVTREIEQLGLPRQRLRRPLDDCTLAPSENTWPPERRLLTRHVPWLLLRAPDLLKADERADLDRVLAADASLAVGYKLV